MQITRSDYYNATYGASKLCVLPPDLERKALIELKEYPEKRMDDIEELRKMVLGEKNLRVDVSDASLIRFLRAKKFDKEGAFVLMKKYYEKWQALQRMAGCPILPSSCKDVAESDLITVLPKTDKEGRYIVYVNYAKWDTRRATFNLIQVLIYLLLVVEKGSQVELSQICGIHAIVDFKNFSVRHMRYFTPHLLYFTSSCAQNALPLRIKSLHFVGETIFLDMVWKICKMFLSSKIRNRVHFHGNDLSSLHTYIPPEILPAELGGSLDHVDSNELRRIMYESEEEFKRKMEYGFVTE